MTWEWVVLILGVLAALVGQGYINVLRQRTAIAAQSLGIDTDATAAAGRNGHS